MFIIYLHTKCHMSISHGSLVTPLKVKAKYGFHAVTIHLFFIVQAKNYLKRSCIFLEYLLTYTTSGSYIKYQTHLTSSCVCHIVITDCMKFKCTRLVWRPMEYFSYQIT